MNETTADVEFFWDPMCPWAWITSRWVAEVARQRDLSVDWRFISLRMVNADRDYERDFPAGYIAGHGSGLKILRVAAAVREAEGRQRMGEIYTQVGGDIHVRRRREELTQHYEEGFPDYLRSIGLESYVDAANDEGWDPVVQADTDEALRRTGKDVGTPIISFFRDGTEQSFFGPVISRVPTAEEAVRLWDAMWEVATFGGFAELKRSLRERPQLDTSLDLEPS
ncbi:MAG: mycothiol-dependent nitroreductase Rv2466c family protein [Acidimicrobiales bacterium]